MTCTPFKAKTGEQVIACTGRRAPARAPRCCALRDVGGGMYGCGRKATLQCDGTLRRKSGESCDRYICDGCTTQRPDEFGGTHDLCPGCVALERKAERTKKQGDLFNGGDK